MDRQQSACDRHQAGWWTVAAVVGATLTVRQLVHAAGTPAIDFAHVWHAAHQLLGGTGAYADPLFTYPPSAALLLAPAGAVPFSVARALMLALNVAAILAAGLLLVRLLRGRIDVKGVAAVLVLTGALDAVASTWANGNINGILLLLEVVGLQQFLRAKWASGAAAIGVSLALKPVLLPMLSVLVVRRRWRALLVAAGIPVALLALGWLVVPDAHRYVTVGMPYLVRGAQLPFNDSLVGFGYRLGLGAVPVLVARIVIAALATAAYLRGTVTGAHLEGRSRIFAEIGVGLSATLLVSPISETYYTLFLLPAIGWWYLRGRRAALLAATTTLACFGTLRLTGIPGDVHHSWSLLAIRPTLGWLVLLGVLAITTARGRGRSHRLVYPNS